MQIDSIQPIQGPSPASPERHVPPTKGHTSELRPHSEVRNPSTGNTLGAQETDKALREVGKAVEPFNVSLKFTKDEETGKIVVEMIDQTSGETLQQFPNKATLQVAATLSKLQGKIFNRQA